jgi:hypothetical protein
MDAVDKGNVSDNSFIGMIKRIEDGAQIEGLVASIKHYTPDDEGDFEYECKKYALKDEKTVKNTLCDKGNALAAQRFMNDAETVKATHMSVGTGAPGGKSSASTELTLPVAPRVVMDSITCPASGDPADNVVVYVCTFPAGVGTGSLTEAGIFTHLTTGFMICYTDFGVVTKAAADIVIFTWTITFGTS